MPSPVARHASGGSLAGAMSALVPRLPSAAPIAPYRDTSTMDSATFATPSNTASRAIVRARPKAMRTFSAGAVVSPTVCTTMSTLTIDAVTAGAPLPSHASTASCAKTAIPKASGSVICSATRVARLNLRRTSSWKPRVRRSATIGSSRSMSGRVKLCRPD